MNERRIDEVTPEELMAHFHGPGLTKMILVTVIAHLVIVMGSSVTYLKQSFLGGDAKSMTKEERVEQAVSDATSALRKIAEHGLSPQDISERFSSGGARAAKQTAPAATEPAKGQAEAPKPEKPQSAIEKEIGKQATGPQVPPAGGKDDIF